MRENTEARFEVKPGRITYAGDLIYRDFGRIRIANRGLRVLDWLEEKHPALLRKHDFEYVGYYPDPFPDYYRGRLAQATKPVRDESRAAPKPGKLPLPVRELWKESRVRSVSLSPGGRYAAASVSEGVKHWGIELYDLENESVRTLATGEIEIEGVRWIKDDVLMATLATFNGLPVVTLYRFDEDGSQTMLTAGRPGVVVDTLPGDPGHILFATIASDGRTAVHRIDIRSQAALGKFKYNLRERLNIGLEGDYSWFTDGAGNIRAALVERDEGADVLVHGGDRKFQTVLELDEPGFFTPLAVSADGRLVYGLSESERDQRELVEFDPATRKITRTLFSKPGVDVVRPLFDDKHQPIGATYYEGGRLVSEYFDKTRQSQVDALQRAFPGRTIAVIDRDRSGRNLLLWVDGIDQPPQIYHVNADAGRASLLDESAPWLADRTLAPGHIMRVRAKDGLEIEAFLTLPAGDRPRPLVVMPHGGPIGVADRPHFNPEVQFLASLGYAVLQINFRGSAGYGKAFREAGHGGHGTVIEDDVEAALAEALKRFPLDPGRMCMLGSSYGGYSSLVSAVRSPDRFRCVVSIAGVSDRTLFFTSSDAGRSEQGRRELERVIGDPRTEGERMIATSPLFQVEKLTTPVMLVHGAEDMRVDYEHTRRLVRMLGMAGHPPVVLRFEDEGHGLDDLDNIETAWEGIAGFLRQHLDERPPAATGS
ncbi:alpha/beta hydrolase family protein [Arenimonas daejeonensis]|uniref:alpha/beta hydrolase family protein n=1 Tax=Arenimonas daejeonensis TaxID=370777 RepID=UPI0011BF7D6D|nr:S9 family peptidase [Arenimonas daejeonensis]